MEKRIVNYDEITGTITMEDGTYLGVWIGATEAQMPKVSNQSAMNTRTVLALQKRGASISEILQLADKGLI